jgi:hypothetical protein
VNDRLEYVTGLELELRMIRRRGGEFGDVIYSSALPVSIERGLTDARPALTPCRPVSQTSPSFSTSFKPEILIESQEYVCLEVSIQGIESAIAVKHDNSCPSNDAASAC